MRLLFDGPVLEDRAIGEGMIIAPTNNALEHLSQETRMGFREVYSAHPSIFVHFKIIR